MEVNNKGSRKDAKRIAKNSSYIMGANIVKKALSFILTIIVARYLGVESFGELSFSLSFVALFSIITDFGAQTLINREIARNRKDVNLFVSNVMMMKILLSVVFFIVIFSLSWLLGYEGLVLTLIFLAGVIQMLQSFDKPLSSAFRGFEIMQFDAISTIVQISVKLLLAAIVIWFDKGLLFLMVAYLISALSELVLRLLFYHLNVHRLKWDFDLSFAKDIFIRSIPFGVAALFMTFYDKIDIFMLSKMIADPDLVIGGYSAAYGLLWAFEFIPISVGGGIYPYISRLYLTSKKRFSVIIENIMKYFYYMTIPLAFGTTILARDIMSLIYGNDYLFATVALQVLIWSVIFKFQMYSMGLALNSMNKEKVTMRATIMSLLLNVILNFFLIPKYSFVGASITTVFSEIVYFAYGFFHLKKDISISNFRIVWKPLLSSILMALVVYSVRGFAGFIGSVAAGAFSYGILMVLLKAFEKDDLLTIRSIIRK